MKIKNYITAAVILLVLDLLWLKIYMSGQYQTMVVNIQSKQMSVNIPSAIAAYSLMIFGLCWFVMQNIDEEAEVGEKARKSFLYGGLFGLMVYGIYNFTAAAVFKNWSSKTLVMDIIWGVIVYSLSAFIGSLV
jgi:uncharacterized membrane protein